MDRPYEDVADPAEHLVILGIVTALLVTPILFMTGLYALSGASVILGVGLVASLRVLEMRHQHGAAGAQARMDRARQLLSD